MNWIGFGTLIKREVGRFFSVYRQTVLPGVITSALYIAIFGFTLEQRISEIQGVPYYWTNFFFCNFSGSGAPTEELFTIFQQPWKFATL